MQLLIVNSPRSQVSFSRGHKMTLTCAVKEHVEAVRNEAEWVGPHSIEQLDEGEGEVEDEEAEQVSGVCVREDESDPADDLLSPPNMSQLRIALKNTLPNTRYYTISLPNDWVNKVIYRD